MQEEARRQKVFDAIPWTKSSLLLATDRGLRIFAQAEDKARSGPVDTGARRVTRLARDDLGHLWLAGGGLAVFEPASNKLHSLDALPMLDSATISALSPDPTHASGIVLAIEARGVVYVRIE